MMLSKRIRISNKEKVKMNWEALTDEVLMQKLSRGNLEACSLLFKRYHRKIYNFFLSSIRDSSTSEDLTQMVFERLLKYKSSYTAGKSFQTWLYQIARNILTDYYNSKRLNLTDISKAQHSATDAPLVSQKIESSEKTKQLHQAIANLKAEQREIILLCKFQKLKMKEVAELLQCSESAAKVRLHRAIKVLGKEFFKLDTL